MISSDLGTAGERGGREKRERERGGGGRERERKEGGREREEGGREGKIKTIILRKVYLLFVYIHRR